MTDRKDIFKDDKDEVIIVSMPKKDYLILREIIDDRKSVRRSIGLLKNVGATLLGIIVTWIALGEHIVKIFKGSGG